MYRLGVGAKIWPGGFDAAIWRESSDWDFPETSVLRTLVILIALLVEGCASLSHDSAAWRGQTEGRIKVQVISFSATHPAEGWLVEADQGQAVGFIRFTKQGSGSFRYKKQAFFKVDDKWDPAIVYIGRFESKDGSIEFCAINPEHGGFHEGDTFIITNTYDYCARLVRQ